MLKGFKEFVMRGNVIELAVAFVVGTAFTLVVTALVDNLVTPLIAAIFGEPDLSGVLSFTINEAHFSIGAVLDAALNFLLVAAAVYFVLVMPLNRLKERQATGKDETPPAEDIVLLREIRDALRNRSI